MENNNDFSFSGKGNLGGGEYGKLRFSGAGHINGDVTCAKFHSSGSFRADGSIRCSGEVESSGSFKCGGGLYAEKIGSSGSVTIDQDVCVTGKMDSSGSTKLGGHLTGGLIHTSGSLHVGEGMLGGSLHTSGSVTIGKNVKAEKLESSGSIRIGGDCEAESFTSSGKVIIDGLLNAEEILIKIGKAECIIGEIGGKRIDIRRGVFNGVFDFGLRDGKLITSSIEGDEITLENTKAKIVRGTKIYVGSGCEIDEVEYAGSFESASDAIVKASHKSNGSAIEKAE